MYIDSTSVFTWPLAWYLRDRSKVMYEIYPNKTEDISQKILIVHSNNYKISEMPNSITHQKVPHRWWFPEYTYRNLSLSNFIPSYEQLMDMKERAIQSKEFEGIEKFTSLRKSIKFDKPQGVSFDIPT